MKSLRLDIRFLKLLLCLPGLFCGFLLLGEVDTIVIRSDFVQSDIRDYGSIFLESNHELNFQKIEELDDAEFKPLKETGISFPPQKAVYWVKFYVKNEAFAAKKLLLEVRNPRINNLQVFLVNNTGEAILSGLSGDDFPFWERDVKHRYFLFPTSLAGREIQTVFVYADKYSETIMLKMLLHDQDIFFEQDQESVFLFSVYTGVLLSICLFVFISAILARRRLLSYFLGYSLSVAFILIAWTGLGFQYFWPQFPYFNSLSGNLFTITASISLLALTRNYLETKKHFPRFDLFLHFIQYLLIGFMLYLFVYRRFSDSFGHIVVFLGLIIQLVYLSSVMLISVLSFRKSGNRDHLIFISGFFFALLASMVQLFVNLDIFDSNLFAENAVFVGFLIDMLALMFIISNEIRKTFIKNIELNNTANKWRIEAATALLDGQRQERQRLSQELHDGLSIRLATLKMRLSNLLGEFQNGHAKNEADKLLKNIGVVAEQVRNLTHELAPLDLKEQSLKEAIEDLVFDMESVSPDLIIKNSLQDFDETKLSELASHNIYQTLQELLNNVLKHSEASSIHIQLETNEHRAVLIVQDNGKGIDMEKNEKGIGLKNVASRATFLNGKFSMNSTSNGSCFTFSFPL